MKKELTNDVEFPNTDTKDKIIGKDIHHAPQPALTTRNTTAWSTGGATKLDSTNTTRLDNLDQRILDIENVLIKLGLLRHK